MQSGQIKQLKEAQAYLNEYFGIEYTSLQGLSDMIKRRSLTDMITLRPHPKEKRAARPPVPNSSPSTLLIDEARTLLLNRASNPLSATI